MNILNFTNGKPNHFFNPKFSYYICEDDLKIDTVYLSKFLISKEKYILNKYSFYGDGETGLSKNSVTTRFAYYNLLDFKETSFLKKYIRDTHDKFLKNLNQKVDQNYYIQCWYNVMRKGDQIKPHIHGYSPDAYLGGHFCVQCDDTSTYYINPVNQINDPETYKSLNEEGKLTLFQNCIPHYTDKQNSNSERITIAFDLEYTDIQNNFVKLF